MKPLHSVVEQQIDNYVSEKVTITDAYQFSQYETIQQIENFMHSKFTSGQFDSRGNPKPFFNITKGKVNIAIRATDIDRKDIKMKETTSDDYFRSFVASKYNQELMKKMRLQDYLNECEESS
jgi:lipase chaperone LimK